MNWGDTYLSGAEIAVIVFGLFAQGLFAARTLIQWILSERAKRVVSPTIFWQLSLWGSILLMIYGWMRGDFVIILGQIISYYIYIWNLDAKKFWKKLHPAIRYGLTLLPAVAILYAVVEWQSTAERLFGDQTVGWQLVMGTTGQLIFTFRFVYQWLYSRKRNESILPAMFWILSIVGASITFIYGIFRLDPVLLLGQGGGVIAYARNLWIDIKARRVE